MKTWLVDVLTVLPYLLGLLMAGLVAAVGLAVYAVVLFGKRWTMTKWVFAVALVAGLMVPTGATQWRYLAFEQLTAGASAVGFTAATINAGNGHSQADVASCTVSTAQVRYRVDGTDPTSTVGAVANAGDTIPLLGNDVLNRFKVIRTGASSGVLDCSLGGW